MKNISKKFLILAFVLIAFYLILVFVIFSNSQSSQKPSGNKKPLPTPTSVQIQQNTNRNPNQNNSVEFSPEEIVASKKERSIGELLHKLPHKGIYFELNYEYQTDSFNYIIDLTKQQEADLELNDFLKTYGLTKIDLQNLSTASK